ncbi:VanY-A/VanY-F/VanY-M family D-Ala-D-Ala carboxypeptidase [Paenibacillus sp. H1-7]|uniref:VanY-A/VanY-F/VanY-M family D-Ala-D-Ala carboxypeptidase n=1 Tax=Paenibacillus sp. H1-7 TaxID=2282849 RepID=UPI001EF91823|nr:VanY-A/VanY-F/VanY-M family D-Ala-D-Ala carboxypeptidase [Paenibacillus sp. H1-7]ULL16924.1 VanY-A/VanY-F/VanY-M family D-Ala-D-Ala carboxypeptidase [Paenibacillus sp. H1-7]
MKKWLFLFAVLLVAGGIVFEQNEQLMQGYPAREKDQEAVSQLKQQTITITKDQVYQGDLLLVNKEYPVHKEGIKSDVIKLSQHKQLIRGYGLLDNRIQLSESVAQRFIEMVGAAQKDKVSHFSITSGYRGLEEQSQLYQEMGSDYALPAGYSEHNLGLSLDIGSTQMEMNQAPEGKWLNKNAWKYGFILRYPKDKAAITGIQYEPWHYRYIGLPHSAIMQEKRFVLEQYLDYLKKEKSIAFTVDGTKYQVAYYPVSQNTAIKVPANRQYEISGNNMDGIIVTVRL